MEASAVSSTLTATRESFGSRENAEKIRILAVDDEKDILDIYRETLCPSEEVLENFFKSAGSDQLHTDLIPCFEVTICSQGQEAVEAVRTAREEKNPYAVLFLDVYIPPGPDGLWVAEHVRKLDPELSIVMATGHTDFDLIELAQRVPPLDKLMYIMKPFNPQEIWQFAAALSAKWNAERGLSMIRSDLENMVNRRTSELLKTNNRLRKEIENRVKAEQAEESSTANFRNMITSSSDGIIILSEQGSVCFMNPAAEELFQTGSENFIGKPFGFPVNNGKITELEIARNGDQAVTAEMRVVKTQWEGDSAYLASLRDVTYRKQIEIELQRSLSVLHETIEGTVQAMALAVETRDPYTAGHQRRVAELTRRIGEGMGLSEKKLQGIFLAALIHDIGKISVPAEILSKPGRLTKDEFNLIKCHPQVAFDILKGIEFPWPIVDIIFQHHERIDGSGYPRGLDANQILKESKILAVADVVEAMASHRPYRPAVGIDKALEEITTNKGKLYDPDVVDVCLELFEKESFVFEL